EDVHRFHKEKMDKVVDEKERVDLLCELNVIEQVANVCKTTTLQNAWQKKQNVTVHGLVYNLRDGILKNLDVSVSSNKA
ncbi:MAG: carbonic anhydrase, partial [Colwellia sp.]|nr:carbonic anhydrase [Colwellia sp.]